jgi:hypothetical protein
MAIIERFNKTMWNKIKKYTAASGNFEFVDKISLLIKNYNNCKHSTTKLKPIDVFQNKTIPLLIVKQQDRKIENTNDLKIGIMLEQLSKRKISLKNPLKESGVKKYILL